MEPIGEVYIHHPGLLDAKDQAWLGDKFRLAIREVLRRYPASELAGLDEVEASLVDDAAIAAIHGEFLQDATATDVITFAHGEIIISVETAARRGKEFGKDERGESLMYLVHGLLHLAGLDDRSDSEAALMAQVQEEVWLAIQGGSDSIEL